MKFSTFILGIIAVGIVSLLVKSYFSTPQQTKEANRIVFGTPDQKIIKLKKEIDATMKHLLAVINGIKDTDTARNAVQPLKQIATDLDSYLDRMKNIPMDDKLQIKNYMMDFVKYLKQPLRRLRSMPEAAHIIDPSIQQIDTVLMFYKPI